VRKLIGLVAVSLCLAVVSSSSLAPVDAQVKDKKAKVDPKKDAKKEVAPAEAGWTVEVYKAKDGFRFRIKDADDKTVAMPTKGYETKEEVLKLLDQIKVTLNKVKPTEAD